MTRSTLLATAAALAMSLSAAAAQSPSATATMKGPDGAGLGTISLQELPSGMLHVFVEMTGLPPGPHGFHVHEKGECDGAGGFESAGGHYAGGHEHGSMTEAGPHAGDFPNVHVASDGVLKVEFFTDRLTLSDGDNPLMDEDGSAFVVHADPDDYQSQPSGNAGDRIACGVVTTPS